MTLAAVGILASILGVMMVRGKEGGNPASALNAGTYISSVIVVIASIIMSKLMFGNFNSAIAVVPDLPWE